MLNELSNHIEGLQRYAYVLCRNHHDADDLVQETLVKAISAAHTYKPEKDLRVWLFAILHNTFISSKRKLARRTRAAAFLDGLSEQDGEVQTQQEQNVEARHTVRMMARLTPDQQAALSLIALEDMSYEEAAGILDVPVGTLMSRLARGRDALRKMMSGKEESRFKVVR
ncbi:sigma-70 family RNA polymerase sigma factor [Paremcibacter congregatus]|uniref:sigma-70 family RNA polymerase sigma factor n=1 Tax=Paremcibacter congregatus TaxID=2043170 RepID=UPI0030EC8056|tara:strand:- start:1204 stop:1710 length:507 start_codon:yes stop_codon:yes gene_type:complete